MGTARALVVGSGSWLARASVTHDQALEIGRRRSRVVTYPAWSWRVSKFLLNSSDMVAAVLERVSRRRGQALEVVDVEELYPEDGGAVEVEEWKRRRMKEKWSPRDDASA